MGLVGMALSRSARAILLCMSLVGSAALPAGVTTAARASGDLSASVAAQVNRQAQQDRADLHETVDVSRQFNASELGVEDFAQIYTAEDIEACRGATLPETLGISSPDTAARDAMAACLVRKWAGGRYWSLTTLELAGQKVPRTPYYRAGFPIGLKLQDYYRTLERILAWSGEATVLSAEVGAQEGPLPVEASRISVTAVRFDSGEEVFSGSGVTGVLLPEGVFRLTVKVGRPQTPRAAAGQETFVRTVIVRDPANDRNQGFVGIKIVPPDGHQGTGITLTPTASSAGRHVGTDDTLCRQKSTVRAEARFATIEAETDLSLVSQGGTWSSYAARWTLKKASGETIATLDAGNTFDIDPSVLADGQYTLEAALRHNDLPTRNGLRFSPSPATFSITVRCEERAVPSVGQRVPAQILISELNADGSTPTISTNATLVDPDVNNSGPSACRSKSWQALVHFGELQQSGSVGWDALDNATPYEGVTWELLHQQSVVETGTGSRFSVDPSNLGDGTYTLVASTPESSGNKVESRNQVQIRNCAAPRISGTVAGGPPGGATTRVCRGEGTSDQNRTQTVDCTQLFATEPAGGADTQIAYENLPQWKTDVEQKTKTEIEARLVPAVHPFEHEEGDDVNCEALKALIDDMKSKLKVPCDKPKEMMSTLYEAQAHFIDRLGKLLKDSTEYVQGGTILRGLPEQVAALDKKKAVLLEEARRKGLVYRACPGQPQVELADGVPLHKLLFKKGKLAELENMQRRWSTLHDDWFEVFSDFNRDRYRETAREINQSFANRAAELNGVVEGANELKLKLHDLWWQRSYPHCIGGPPMHQTAAGVLPRIPGMELVFFKAPTLKPVPDFDSFANKHGVGEPDWMLDGTTWARILRNREREKAVANAKVLEELTSLKETGQSIARKTGESIWAGIRGIFYDIPKYVFDTPIDQLEANYDTAFDAVSGGAVGAALTEAGTKALAGTILSSYRAFLEKFKQADGMDSSSPQGNLRAAQAFGEANKLANAALAEHQAFTSMEALLAETIAGFGFDRAVGAAGNAVNQALVLQTKRKQLERTLNLLKKRVGEDRAKRIQAYFDKHLSTDNLEKIGREVAGTLTREEADRISRHAQDITAGFDDLNRTLARESAESDVVSRLRTKAAAGDPKAREALEQLERVDDRIEVSRTKAQGLLDDNLELRENISTLEENGAITTDEAMRLRDSLNEQELALFENEVSAIDFDPPSRQLDVDPFGGSSTDPSKPDVVALARGDGPLEATSADGTTRSFNVRHVIEADRKRRGTGGGATADILLTDKGAVKVAIKGDLAGEKLGSKAASERGIRQIEIQEEGQIFDPREGTNRAYVIREIVEENSLGSTVKKNLLDKDTGRLPPDYQRAMLEMLDDLVERKVFWGDFKLDNVAFKARPDGKIDAYVLDSDYLKTYDQVKAKYPKFSDEDLRKFQFRQAFSHNRSTVQEAFVGTVDGGAAGSFYKYIDRNVVDEYPRLKKGVDDYLIKHEPDSLATGGTGKKFEDAWDRGDPPQPKSRDGVVNASQNMKHQVADVQAEIQAGQQQRDDILGGVLFDDDELGALLGDPSTSVSGPALPGQTVSGAPIPSTPVSVGALDALLPESTNIDQMFAALDGIVGGGGAPELPGLCQ